MSSYDFVQHGQSLVDSGQYQEAVKVCRLGLLAHPTALAGRLILGNALIALRRYEEVLAEMRVALEIDSANPRALALKGEALLHKGDTLQAAHILNQAYAYAPTDKRLASLCRQAESRLAANAADPYDFGGNETSATKHYPAHRGLERDSAHEISDNVTRPQSVLGAPRSGRAASPPYAPLDTGTMDIDPSLEAYEIEGYEVDAAPLDPAAAGEDFEPSDSMAMTSTYGRGELMLPGRGVQALEGPAGPQGAKETAHYRKLPERRAAMVIDEELDDDMTEEETSARDLRGDLRGDLPSRPPLPSRSPLPPPYPVADDAQLAASRRTVLSSSPASASPGGPPPFAPGGAPRPVASPPMDELFPENDPGVSRLVEVPDLARAVQQVRPPNQPTLAISSPQKEQRPPNVQDMQVIRAGLGLNPEGTELKSIVELYNPPQFGAPQQPLPPQQLLPPPSMIPPMQARQPSQQDRQRGATVAASVPTGPMTRKRSPWIYLLYAVIATLVVAGGVFAGFRIREIRLDREIQATEKDALAYAQDDTYGGYLRARGAYSGIVSVRATRRTRSALARMQAAITAEFGDGYDETKSLVQSVGGIDTADAALARAYLALAEGDPGIARLRAGDVERGHPAEPLGPYLRGRAALLDNKPDEAIAAFDKALKQGQRPFIHIGLGRAHLASGALDQARERFERALQESPNHPDAVIGLAQVAVTSGVASNDLAPHLAALRAIINDYDKEGAAGASQRQRAQAALTLASVELMRGDRDAAQTALGQVRELMPLEDRYFSNDYIQVLQAIGDTEAAENEANRAASKWPDAVDARVALAELALLRGQPEQVFTVLEGDISGNARALSVRSRAHLLLGNSKAALADSDAALVTSAALPEVLAARAEVDLALGDVLAAQARLEPIYSPRAPPRVRTVYAAVLRRQGKFDEARAIVAPLLEIPPSQRAYLELARLERAQGEFAKAREAYDELLSQAPGSLEARLESALLTHDTGNIKKARAVLEELVAAHPTCSRALLEAAPLFTLTGAYEKARQVLDQAEKLEWAPRWQIARERGRLALRRGERSTALSTLSTARNLQEDDLESRMLLLDAQLKEEDGPGARKTVEDILKHFSRGEAMRDMARARLDLAEDRIEDALKTYKLARAQLIKERATPREIAVTEYWTGRAHFLADRLNDASKSFISAVKRDPGNADAQFYLGLSSFYLKRWVTVTRAMEATLDVDPAGNPEAWHYLGVAHSNRKRWADAKKAFKEYLARYPEGYLAEEARAALRRLR